MPFSTILFHLLIYLRFLIRYYYYYRVITLRNTGGRPNVNDAYLTTLPEVFEVGMLSAKMGKNKSNAANCTIQHWLKAGKIEPTGKLGQYIKSHPATQH